MPYSPRPCSVCGAPLPEQRRGRPAQACPGACRRKLHNRRSWNARIERFRAAHRFGVDRSDDLPWLHTWDGEGDLDDLGFSLVRSPWDYVHGEILKAAVNHWEEQTRLLRQIHALMLASGVWDGVPTISREEHAELVRRKAEREARPRRLIDRLLES